MVTCVFVKRVSWFTSLSLVTQIALTAVSVSDKMRNIVHVASAFRLDTHEYTEVRRQTSDLWARDHMETQHQSIKGAWGPSTTEALRKGMFSSLFKKKTQD